MNRVCLSGKRTSYIERNIMFAIPKLGEEGDGYDGSRIFNWLADVCGLSVDLVSFIYIC